MNLLSPLLLLAFAIIFAAAEDKIVGYGTKFGTELSGSHDKVIGLGAPPGLLVGAESEEDVLEVYHRYQLYQELLGEDSNAGYAEKNCEGGCPEGSHCSYGICFCETEIVLGTLEVGSGSESSSKEPEISQGSHQLEGACVVKKDNRTSPHKMTLKGELKSCNQSSECWSDDINLRCSDESQCTCREGMKYNEKQSECNIYLAVDCSSFSHNSPVAQKLATLVADILAGNITTDNTIIPDSLLAYLEPLSSGTYTKEELLEAYCRDVEEFAAGFADIAAPFGVEEESFIVAVALAVVVVVLLLFLGCVCLAGCICWCCFDSCKLKVENFFSPNSYSQGIDNKGGIAAQESSDEKDDLEKVISGYQPVPQQPPPSYPQGTSSLPRGASLPRTASLPRNGNGNGTNSLKRGVSPIPRAYPQLAQAPPGYPESPQKTGPAPPGYPQSPPEYPQTPTPPGYPANSNKQTTVSLYPQIPEK